MEEIIKSTAETIFVSAFSTEDGGVVRGPIGVGYLPQKSEIFFYPADGNLMIKNGVTDFSQFLKDWLTYTKIINKYQIDPNEIEACNRANSYYLDYIEKHFGDAKIVDRDKKPPFSKQWNIEAWKSILQKPEFVDYLNNHFNFDFRNVSTL